MSMQENEYQVPTTTFPSGSYSIKGKERQSQDFGQSPHSGIQSLKGKERQYQDFDESVDGDKSREKQTPLQDYEEIETDEDKILNPEGPLKQHLLRDFDTVGELKQWAQDWAWSEGFTMSMKNLKTNRNVYLKCSQGGYKKTGCKYEVSGRFSARTNLWSLCARWLQNTHNHEPAPAISGLLTHRIFDKALETLLIIIHLSQPAKPAEQSKISPSNKNHGAALTGTSFKTSFRTIPKDGARTILDAFTPYQRRTAGMVWSPINLIINDLLAHEDSPTKDEKSSIPKSHLFHQTARAMSFPNPEHQQSSQLPQTPNRRSFKHSSKPLRKIPPGSEFFRYTHGSSLFNGNSDTERNNSSEAKEHSYLVKRWRGLPAI
ncbi:hypothetical protein PPACK8108_LOCUS14451 [Phakopsora pachyrhizi]|uniref:FAR1 domain-containing protein n=1 Tax=Phakopsora pachyrhizi TaxID=170000 RepID=A0AAV0B545_PHAPC|nr:hypothetical protein PPACK8108_LOCUS14451 [Phakopsora pachyrhizi]